jgi:ABC-type Fe3+ transport system permease subunit
MNWMARHRRRLAITLIAFAGAISAAFSGFSGGRFLQHHVDFGGGSDWSHLNNTLSIAEWLGLLALVCGVVFLVLVWWRGHGNDNWLA